MTFITFQNGSVVMSGDFVGTEQGCCCGDGGPCPPGFEPRVQKSVGLYLDDPAAECPAGFDRIDYGGGLVECRGHICLESVTVEQWLACQDADPTCPGYNCIYTASCAEYQDFINANGGGIALGNGIIAWETGSTLPCCEVGVDCCDSSVFP